MDTSSFAAIKAHIQSKQQSSSAPSPTPTQTQPKPSHIPSEIDYCSTTSDGPELKKPRINSFNPQTQADVVPAKRSIPPIKVNKTQKGNPLLKSLRVPWTEVHNAQAYDYLIRSRRVLFLSLKYHKLHPEYLERRTDAARHGSERPVNARDGSNLDTGNSTGVLLILLVDVPNAPGLMKEINKLCLYSGVTLLCAFSFAEAGKYINALASS